MGAKKKATIPATIRTTAYATALFMSKAQESVTIEGVDARPPSRHATVGRNHPETQQNLIRYLRLLITQLSDNPTAI